MISQHQQLINDFEHKFCELLQNYSRLKEENQRLSDELAQKKEELLDAHSQIVNLRSNYDSLKIAQSIGNTEEDKKKAYKRLTRLVRDVDTCLDLLKD
ncbi:MAG: hypothetical protein KBB61_05405 [Paludibacteraceae bacterium]|jgi:chromosome segregation ATPase|nr:hypothetical protein [Paludibacteraceae bacterium]MDI9536494.1 hypothetical protein [Bacteroidota bacterium]HHT61477.1 hypothetical protein [Bacteroidales bacterium]MBP9039312.1 hypothetical protein [Paludibacteraceae bacterium]HOA47279.1 hypothetical protein [Paludibacteraceae bacterium]